MKAAPYLAALTILMTAPRATFAKSRSIPGSGLGPRSLTTCESFISHEQIGQRFQYIEAEYTDLAARFVIGESVEGREIFALRLSSDPTEESSEPEVRIIGGIHGDECMSAQLVADMASWLISSYGVDPIVTRLIDDAEVVLVPLVNPDGYTGTSATRNNANNIDLNRNLHFAWTGTGGAPFSEPETRAIRDLSDDNSFTVGLSYHTAASYVNAPWNYTPHHPPDEELFKAMGEAYAGESSYNVVFGWDWYNIEGDVNDWSLGVKGTFDWTIELTGDIDPQFDIHSAGLEGFLSFVFQGIQGVVTDSTTGEPLSARIEVSPDRAPVFTDPDVGDYHRILLPGRYDITAVAEGYTSETRMGVIVEEDNATIVDFELAPVPDRRARFAFSVNGMTLPRPVAKTTYTNSPYLNRTMAWNALGAPDSEVYSLSPAGTITLDMGEETWIENIDGPDIIIVAGQSADEPAEVYAAESQDGPFEEVASGVGTFEVDIAPSGFDAIRFVRLVDQTDGPFNDEFPGYDLDAVINLSSGPYRAPDGGIAVDAGGGDNDAGIDDEDAGEMPRAVAGDCGCKAAGTKPRASVIEILEALFETE